MACVLSELLNLIGSEFPCVSAPPSLVIHEVFVMICQIRMLSLSHSLGGIVVNSARVKEMNVLTFMSHY